MKLTKDSLIKEAEIFCSRESAREHPELVGISDGKSTGTKLFFSKFLEFIIY